MSDRPSVFISYRRIDTNWATVSLRFHIRQHLPALKVFMDVESIDPGANFVDEINDTVDRCQAILVLIGPNWLGVSDNHGRRRLDNPNDFVRLEVSRALERGILVIPVLCDGAEMPPADALPKELADLVFRNAVTIAQPSHDRDLKVVSDALKKAFLGIEVFDAKTSGSAPPPQPSNAPAVQNGDVSAQDVADALMDAGVDGKTVFAVARQRNEDGKYVLAEALYCTASNLLTESEGPEDVWTLSARHNAAHAALSQGKAAEAEEQFSDLLST